METAFSENKAGWNGRNWNVAWARSGEDTNAARGINSWALRWRQVLGGSTGAGVQGRGRGRKMWMLESC